MTNGMRIVLPRHLLAWVDDNRGARSREAFVVQALFTLKDTTGNKNETIYQIQSGADGSKGSSK